MIQNYYQEMPKCLDDDVFLNTRWMIIHTSDKKDYPFVVYKCKKCRCYLGAGKMEKDKENLADIIFKNYLKTFPNLYGNNPPKITKVEIKR